MTRHAPAPPLRMRPTAEAAPSQSVAERAAGQGRPPACIWSQSAADWISPPWVSASTPGVVLIRPRAHGPRPLDAHLAALLHGSCVRFRWTDQPGRSVIVA